MLFLPAFCPYCKSPPGRSWSTDRTKPNVRGVACGCQTFGKILPELLITKTAVESTREGTDRAGLMRL